jgi:pyruvate/2-oxoglutarate/acetoin dehydrogenase E1 component
MTRDLRYHEAIHEALDLCLARNPAVYVMGLGVPDPKGVFGTTLGLQQKYGPRRVFDMPCAENGMTGVAIGAALAGMRPVLVHQRIDFALLAVEQMINQAAKWHYMFGGRYALPLVVRLIIGRGWGQGPQHSQALQSLFAHIPGLRVVMPATPADAKGLLIASIEDDNPVLFLEHRWLHSVHGPVPEGHYVTSLGEARVVRPGRDLTIVGFSYMTLEALRAAEVLAGAGIEAEVIDLRSLRPWNEACVLASVRRTGRLLALDLSWRTAGFAAEVVATVAEKCLSDLKAAPRRLTLPDCPTPTAPALAASFYPLAGDVVALACDMLGRPRLVLPRDEGQPLDVPDPSFSGPF